MKKLRLTCIFNYAPHYRLPIYRLIDEHFQTDFYFGKNLKGSIRSIDMDDLSGFKNYIVNKNILGTNYLWQKGALRAFFRHQESICILTGSPYTVSNWVIGLCGRLLNRKVWVWTHGMKGEKKGKRKGFEKSFYRLFDKILLYGHYSEKIMLKEGFKEKKLVVIYNSLDYTKQLEIRRNLNQKLIFSKYFKNDFQTLIYVGRLQKVKRLDLILHAMTKLKPEIKINLVLVGKETDGSNLKELVNKLGLSEHVWFYGETYDELEIAELFNESHICISPGPIGLTAIHAATFGVPLITNDNFSKQMPEFEVIKDGMNGSFFKENDVDDLSEKIRLWCNKSDEEIQTSQLYSLNKIKQYYNPLRQLEIIRSLIPQ
ncbi:glycosyltransferase [Aureicoccus marinus]|uniref:Glycosyl transferase family 1 domain-containing protein n=1 Tax=Aureicoccus marinus TaxID=754435 RepID=A0A2S7T6V3_9FLAO|nr:glycosyltransferase [Aureicoccus marinus]PQJ15235.1 hypothetical protein BST99_05375 [Aureicoccus marinus]